MSRTVHYKGTLTEIKPRSSRSLEDLAREIHDERGFEKEPYFDDYLESLTIGFAELYTLHGTRLFEIKGGEIDDESEILEAQLNKDGTINFECRFYNGGASLNECISEAITNIKKADDQDLATEAIKYYFSVLEEARGEGWDENPDHVLRKMLFAVRGDAKYADPFPF